MTFISRVIPGSAPFPVPDPNTRSTFSFDDANRVAAITHEFLPTQGTPSTLASYAYSYNAANELASETNRDGTFASSYDTTGQLTGQTEGGQSRFWVSRNGRCAGYDRGTGHRHHQ